MRQVKHVCKRTPNQQSRVYITRTHSRTCTQPRRTPEKTAIHLPLMNNNPLQNYRNPVFDSKFAVLEKSSCRNMLNCCGTRAKRVRYGTENYKRKSRRAYRQKAFCYLDLTTTCNYHDLGRLINYLVLNAVFSASKSLPWFDGIDTATKRTTRL